jgi:hypothetical protein
MVLLLNGAVGYWDELAIALVAVAVLWIAVRLAGRNPPSDEDDDEASQSDQKRDEDQPEQEPPQQSSKKTR